MSYTDHGFKHELLSALNRCVATSFLSVTLGKKHSKTQPVSEMPPRTPKNLARERYLAIPTFIRQGKTLGL
ncbi:MAG: hypothetical protein WCZ86_12810 [Desulfurivibrionaceae bacterium]|jgi:hypothetical protein